MEQDKAPAAAPRGAELFKDDGKVVVGKNGRLFLHNDTNQVVRQHTGDLLFTEPQLEHWRILLETRVAWLSKLGIPYYFLVPPNAHSVYPEDLPDHIVSGSRRPVLQLIEHLAETDSYARLIYPLEQILAGKPNPLLYSQTDPHWTSVAGFLAYRVLAAQIAELVPIHQVEEADIKYVESMFMGELGYKVDPKQSSPDVWGHVKQPQAYLVHDNEVHNRGSMLSTICPDAPPTTCLLLGDSFSDRLLPMLAASFRHFIYGSTPVLDHALVREVQPDVVIGVQNERFLIEIPRDISGKGVREYEQEKKAAGELRPRNNLWPDPPG